MKNPGLLFLLALSLFACKSKKNTPDISDIKVKIHLDRFEKGFFSMDSNYLSIDLRQLEGNFPGFYKDYMQGILGVSGADTNSETQSMVKLMLSNYSSLYQAAQSRFNNTSAFMKEVEKGFRYVRYYFPRFNGPGMGMITFIGTLDAPGIVLTDRCLAIGLHQYLGKDFPGYQSEQAKQLYPGYVSRRFEPEYIPVNCMKAIVSDLFPDSSGTKSLIDQMIEKGKQWWLLDKFLPETPDSLKTGYTQQQLGWCEENEGLIWSYIIQNEKLRSLDPATIQTYLGEGPFTQGFSQELSPGNIGQWIGRQIVRKFAVKNPELEPAEVMRTDANKILEEAKYKPK